MPWASNSPSRVLVQSAPDGDDGWACKAADPAFTPNPAWARATVNYCRIPPTATAPSLKLACMTATQKSAPGRNPLAAVELSPAQISAGYSVVSGGCESSYAGNGSIHAENIVRSGRTASNAGWSCQAADPPNNGQDATVTATLVACRADLSATDKARFTVPPALQCQVTRTPPSGLQSYPQALARAPSLTEKVFGGECLLSYAGHGSVHAEFMVEHGFHGVDTWGCLGADPPLLPNPGTAQAGVITCHVTPGQEARRRSAALHRGAGDDDRLPIELRGALDDQDGRLRHGQGPRRQGLRAGRDRPRSSDCSPSLRRRRDNGASR